MFEINATPVPAVPDGSPRCPRHAKRSVSGGPGSTRVRISLADLHREPFRIFFPVAVLAGLIGIVLWPLMLGGWMEEYPGTRHARLMIEGFFGGFIFGFLGTSLPRFLETRPLGAWEVLPQFALHLAAIAVYTVGSVQTADTLFLLELALWLIVLGRRLPGRLDLPPPGFVLMPLAFACLIVGLGIEWFGRRNELGQGIELLSRLLGYHAFILLCIMGAGSFLLPRFLGLGVRQKFPTSRKPTPEWQRAAIASAATGVLIILSFCAEAAGWALSGTVARVVVFGAYLYSMMPLERLRWSASGVQWFLVIGLALVPLGIVGTGLWPGWRVSLSHLELVGGFGLITLGVATRVVFGHSGQRPKLERFHLWLTIAAILILLGMLSRVGGDLHPPSILRHYIYGAVSWAAGLVIWSICVLPKVLKPDPEA